MGFSRNTVCNGGRDRRRENPVGPRLLQIWRDGGDSWSLRRTHHLPRPPTTSRAEQRKGEENGWPRAARKPVGAARSRGRSSRSSSSRSCLRCSSSSRSSLSSGLASVSRRRRRARPPLRAIPPPKRRVDRPPRLPAGSSTAERAGKELHGHGEAVLLVAAHAPVHGVDVPAGLVGVDLGPLGLPDAAAAAAATVVALLLICPRVAVTDPTHGAADFAFNAARRPLPLRAGERGGRRRRKERSSRHGHRAGEAVPSPCSSTAAGGRRSDDGEMRWRREQGRRTWIRRFVGQVDEVDEEPTTTCTSPPLLRATREERRGEERRGEERELRRGRGGRRRRSGEPRAGGERVGEARRRRKGVEARRWDGRAAGELGEENRGEGERVGVGGGGDKNQSGPELAGDEGEK
jgi:hypothetical protein